MVMCESCREGGASLVLINKKFLLSCARSRRTQPLSNYFVIQVKVKMLHYCLLVG